MHMLAATFFWSYLGKKYAAASFRFPEIYNTLAFLYISMTLILSMGVKSMERKLKINTKTQEVVFR